MHPDRFETRGSLVKTSQGVPVRQNPKTLAMFSARCPAARVHRVQPNMGDLALVASQ
jgi:hypothetical protein